MLDLHSLLTLLAERKDGRNEAVMAQVTFDRRTDGPTDLTATESIWVSRHFEIRIEVCSKSDEGV